MTPSRAGYKDGYENRAYGWRMGLGWRDLERDHYQDGYTAGVNDRTDTMDAREYHRPDGMTERGVG